MCLVDDVQWLDRASAQALAFVARRLLAESIAMVFAVREPTDVTELNGLPEIGRRRARRRRRALVAGLGHAGAPGRARARSDRRRDARQPTGVAGAAAWVDAGGARGRVRASRRAVRWPAASRRPSCSGSGALPRETQRLLLVAAAEPVGDVSLLWRAAEQLGIRGDAGKPAEEAALIDLGIRVRFRHPLIRSAAYRAAHFRDRQEVHRALAEATDPDTDPDRRAWHRAQAASEPDEALAGELERSADRAQARGGTAAAAAFLARAAELTPDPAGRGRRALAAAQAKFDAAASDAALELLATAELAPLDELERARLERLRAEIAFARTRGSDAPALLLDAARRLEPLDAAMARETHLEAMAAAMYAGRLGDSPGVREAAEAALAAPPAPQPPRAIDLLLDGLATRFTEGYAGRCAAAPQGPRRVPPRRGIDGTRRALALAGVSPGAGSLGRRALVRACDAWAARRARDGRAPRAPDRGHVSRVPTRSCGSVQRRFVADRGGRRDHPGDRDGTAEVRVADAGRVARQRGRGPRADRGWEARGDGEGRGHGAGRRSSGPPRCCTTAAAATPRRSRPPSKAANRTITGSSRGPSWS